MTLAKWPLASCFTLSYVGRNGLFLPPACPLTLLIGPLLVHIRRQHLVVLQVVVVAALLCRRQETRGLWLGVGAGHAPAGWLHQAAHADVPRGLLCCVCWHWGNSRQAVCSDPTVRELDAGQPLHAAPTNVTCSSNGACNPALGLQAWRGSVSICSPPSAGSCVSGAPRQRKQQSPPHRGPALLAGSHGRVAAAFHCASRPEAPPRSGPGPAARARAGKGEGQLCSRISPHVCNEFCGQLRHCPLCNHSSSGSPHPYSPSRAGSRCRRCRRRPPPRPEGRCSTSVVGKT